MTSDITGAAFPRSVADIKARITGGHDPLAFEFEVLIDYLPDGEAAPLCRDYKARDGEDAGNFAGYGPPQHKTYPLDPSDAAHVLAAMIHYMDFGWSKVRDHRGISAGRTVSKMGAWIWLLGHDPRDVYNESEEWGQYGAGCLSRICARFGLPVPEGEDIERMARGEPCVDGCDEGCGR